MRHSGTASQVNRPDSRTIRPTVNLITRYDKVSKFSFIFGLNFSEYFEIGKYTIAMYIIVALLLNLTFVVTWKKINRQPDSIRI